MSKSGRRFSVQFWQVSFTWFQRLSFSFPRFVCSSASFLAHSHGIFCYSQKISSHLLLLFKGLDDSRSWSDQEKKRPPRDVPRLGDTSDTSGGESDVVESQRRIRSKWTYKMNRLWLASNIGRFFVTGPTDVATKLSFFQCHICLMDVSALTHGDFEILRHFQRSKHWGWRHQAGRYWTIRGMPWVLRK